MRKLGSELDVAAMSLYRHVQNKQEVLDAVIERLISEVSAPPTGESWEERLREQVRRYRALAKSNPNLFPLLGRRRMPSSPTNAVPQELVPAEWLLADLVDAGFSADEALNAFRTVMAFTYGYALSELEGFSLERHADAFDVSLADPQRFPHLHTLATRLAANDHDAEYERGLDFIFAGLRASLEREVAAAQKAIRRLTA
jgi:AcrR family transcriptional regulator